MGSAMTAALARTEADERRLDANLDLVLGAWLAARRELRYRDDREALRGALATLRLTVNETVSAFLKLSSDPETGA